jgi:hypothetical protein
MIFHTLTGTYQGNRYNSLLWLEESGNAHLTLYNDGIKGIRWGRTWRMDKVLRNL